MVGLVYIYKCNQGRQAKTPYRDSVARLPYPAALRHEARLAAVPDQKFGFVL